MYTVLISLVCEIYKRQLLWSHFDKNFPLLIEVWEFLISVSNKFIELETRNNTYDYIGVTQTSLDRTPHGQGEIVQTLEINFSKHTNPTSSCTITDVSKFCLIKE